MEMMFMILMEIFLETVDHPNWLITESYNWKLISNKSFNKVTSITFDENNNRFIYQNTDTLSFYQPHK